MSDPVYTNRFYAQYDPSVTEPSPVTGWFDTTMFNDLSGMPPIKHLLPISDAQFAQRLDGNYAVASNALVAFTPVIEPSATPLTTQVATAQAWIQQQANLAAAMGEAFTADMKAYVKAVNAIASGADTASTALPAQPADVMVASAATS